MTCAEARAAFSDLYDETLADPFRAALEAHLEHCPACAREWAAFRRALAAVTLLGSAEPSPGFAARVRQRVETPSRWRRAVRWLFLPLPVKVPLQAFALLLVAFAGLLIYQRSPEVRREAVPPTASVPAPAPALEENAPPPAPPPGAEGTPRQAQGPRGTAAVPPTERAEPPPAPLLLPPPVPEAARVEPARKPLRQEMEASDAPAALPGPPPRAAERETASPRERFAVRTGPMDDLYAAALADQAEQRYDRAAEAFRAFLAAHPQDPRVPEARLHLAETYAAQRRYAEAIPEYEALARDFPQSPLVPTALYRQGEARLALGDRTGCAVFRDLVSRHPLAPEAALARDSLATRCR